MPAITLETPDGTDRIVRDEYHTDKDDFVIAYNRLNDNGIDEKVAIPLHRVVRIDG